MNTDEVITKIAEQTGNSKAGVKEVIDAFRDVIISSIKSGEGVRLVGFLTVEKNKRAARTGHNPATGESIKIPAKNVVKIKAGSKLKDAA
jgi:DNA-binding protein HU-beta